MSYVDCDELHPGNSTTVKLFSVKVDGALNDDAIVTVTVKDSSDNVVSGGNAVAMPNFESGAYKGILPNTLGIVLNARYKVEVTATIAGVGVGFWPITKVAKPRENCAGCNCG
jgi:hypothetical protein